MHSIGSNLAIIIVSWNTRDMLRGCLSSIGRTAATLSPLTVVVDNDSHDGTPEMVRSEFPSVRLVNTGGNLGFGRANNIGLRETNARYILFLNPDTILHQNSLQTMTGVLDDDLSVGAVGARMVGANGETQDLGLQWFPTPGREFIRTAFVAKGTKKLLQEMVPYRSARTSGYVAKLYGGCLMVRKEILDTIGGFDERFFMYCEDVDLCRRIDERGMKLYYCSEACVTHLTGGAEKQAVSSFGVLMRCESIAKLMGKYYGWSGFLAYRIAVVAAALIRLAACSPVFILTSISGSRPRFDAAKYSLMLQWAVFNRKAIVK